MGEAEGNRLGVECIKKAEGARLAGPGPFDWITPVLPQLSGHKGTGVVALLTTPPPFVGPTESAPCRGQSSFSVGSTTTIK